MKEKTLEELQVEHSELCARAADMGMVVPGDLTVDFDTAEAGRTIVSSLTKLVGVAKAPEQEHSAPAPALKKVKAAKAATAKPAAKEAAQQEKTKMAKTAKKAKAPKAAKKTAKKGSTKKATAKKAAAGKGKKTGPREGSMTSKIVAKMKNGGITREQVLKMTGWKAVSMQQLAASAGVVLTKSEERPFVYRAK